MAVNGGFKVKSGQVSDFLSKNGKWIVIAIAVLFILKPIREAIAKIFETVGLNKGADGIAVDATTDAINNQSPFDPHMWQSTPTGGKLLTSAGGQALAKQLENDFWVVPYFIYDEDAVYGVFRGLSTQSQVSHLCWYYKELTGYDLYLYLSERMHSDQMKKIIDMVNNKPRYK